MFFSLLGRKYAAVFVSSDEDTGGSWVRSRLGGGGGWRRAVIVKQALPRVGYALGLLGFVLLPSVVFPQ